MVGIRLPKSGGRVTGIRDFVAGGAQRPARAIRRNALAVRLAGAVVLAITCACSTSPALSAEDIAEGEEPPVGAEAVPAGAEAAPTGTEGAPTGTEEAPTGAEEAPRGVIDAGHAYASAGVRGLGTWIDGFFSDEEYEAEINESWVRVRIDNFAELYEGAEVDAKARLHLKLPALDERVRVEILSAGEAEEDLATADDPGVAQPSDLAPDSITAALSYFIRNDEDISVRARVGLDFDGYEPNPFIGLRYREQVEFSEDWSFRFVQRFRYFSLDGLESRTIFGLDHALPDDRLFRWQIDGTWQEEQPDYFYGVSFSLFQALDAKSAIEHQVINSFRTHPHRLDEVTLRMRYRRQVWREWLTLEAAPQVALPRDRNYEAVPGFLFRIEMTFGG